MYAYALLILELINRHRCFTLGSSNLDGTQSQQAVAVNKLTTYVSEGRVHSSNVTRFNKCVLIALETGSCQKIHSSSQDIEKIVGG